MGRKKSKAKAWRRRIAGFLLLVAIVAALWQWWEVRHWTPDAHAFPEQGVVVGAEDGTVNFRTVRALGGSFAYLHASDGADGQDPRFARDFQAAREAGLMVGAVHRYDPCVMANEQSANFVTIVPRDKNLLPPAIELSRTTDACAKSVSEPAVESELMTLINQIETHAGRPVILKIAPEFEERYGLAARLARNLWLTRTRLEPDYAGRPWLLWTANENLMSEASEEPIGWVVVQP